MRTDIDKYELIEQYLQGALQGSDLDGVESRIESDMEFAKEVQSHKAMADLIFDRSMIDVKQQIRDIHNNNNMPGKSINRGRFYLLVGTILLIGIVVFSVFIKDEPSSDIASLPIQTEENNLSNKKPISYNNEQVGNKQKEIPITVKRNKKEAINKLKSNASYTSKTQSKTPSKTDSIIFDSLPKLSPIINTEIKSTTTDKTTTKNKETPRKIIPLKTSENSEPDVFDCSEIKITASVETTESCSSKPTGSIIISEDSFEGGNPPYQVSIDNAENYYSRYLFENLYAALYSISVKDKNNCESKIGTHVIHSKDCSYEYVFSPDDGEDWKIPTNENTGNVKIYSKSRKLVYQEIFDFPGAYKWNGRSNSGNELPMGVYMFILELDNEEPLVGNVTIVR